MFGPNPATSCFNSPFFIRLSIFYLSDLGQFVAFTFCLSLIQQTPKTFIAFSTP